MANPHSNKHKVRRACPVCRHAVLHLVGDGCCAKCWRDRWSLEDGFWTRRIKLEDTVYDRDDELIPDC